VRVLANVHAVRDSGIDPKSIEPKILPSELSGMGAKPDVRTQFQLIGTGSSMMRTSDGDSLSRVQVHTAFRCRRWQCRVEEY
jgi:hypothetical protein